MSIPSELCHVANHHVRFIEGISMNRDIENDLDQGHAESDARTQLASCAHLIFAPTFEKKMPSLLFTEFRESSQMIPDAAKWNPNFKTFLEKNPSDPLWGLAPSASESLRPH